MSDSDSTCDGNVNIETGSSSLSIGETMNTDGYF